LVRPWEEPGALAITASVKDVEIAAQRRSEAKSDFIVIVKDRLSIDRLPLVAVPQLKTDVDGKLWAIRKGVIWQRGQLARAQQERNGAHSPENLHGSHLWLIWISADSWSEATLDAFAIYTA
jgi:hypothetical protein